MGTSVEQVFVVDGDPLAALEVYRAEAQAGGWQSLGPWCSRYYRTAAFVFGKRTPIPSAMTVWVVLPGAPTAAPPPPDVVAGTAPVLTVTLTAVASPSPEFRGPQLPMGDVGCLPSISPDDPAFQVRPGPPRTSGELCALLPVSRLGRIVPEVTVALPDDPDYEGGNVCTYEQRPYSPTSTVLPIQGVRDSRWWFSVVDVAALPRVLFEDRQFPSASTEPEMFLLSSDVRREAPPLGVWVDTPTGPVVVRTSVDGLDEEQLLAVVRLLRGRIGTSAVGGEAGELLGHEAELAEHAQLVDDGPVVRHLPVGEAPDVDLVPAGALVRRGMPMKSPLIVPLARMYPTWWSPSWYCCRISYRKSGNAPLTADTNECTASRPPGKPGGSSTCST